MSNGQFKSHLIISRLAYLIHWIVWICWIYFEKTDPFCESYSLIELTVIHQLSDFIITRYILDVHGYTDFLLAQWEHSPHFNWNENEQNPSTLTFVIRIPAEKFNIWNGCRSSSKKGWSVEWFVSLTLNDFDRNGDPEDSFFSRARLKAKRRWKEGRTRAKIFRKVPKEKGWRGPQSNKSTLYFQLGIFFKKKNK